MVAKNNYFWTEGCKEIDFIANGDIAVIRRVRRMREAYGFRFADVVRVFQYARYPTKVSPPVPYHHSRGTPAPHRQNESRCV